VHEGQRALEAHCHEHRAQRLAGLGRIHGERIAGEVLFPVFPGLGPLADFFQLVGGLGVLELFFVLEHLDVFRATEQVEMVEHVFGILAHGATPEDR
jgi:hypothetical protein